MRNRIHQIKFRLNDEELALLKKVGGQRYVNDEIFWHIDIHR